MEGKLDTIKITIRDTTTTIIVGMTMMAMPMMDKSTMTTMDTTTTTMDTITTTMTTMTMTTMTIKTKTMTMTKLTPRAKVKTGRS